MEQDLADWMQMGNQILDKPHHTMPSGLKFELAAETPLLMILFNTLSQRIYQRYPQALIRLRNWDYDSWTPSSAARWISASADAKAIRSRGSC